MKPLSIYFILLLGLPLVVDAQHCSLSGKAVDSISGDFLLYSTVRLLNVSDSSLYKGAITGENGTFSLQDIVQGKYIFCISYIGYRERYFDVVFSKGKQHIDLGTVKMLPDTKTLSGVEISEQAPVSTKFDRTVYSVDSLLLSGSISTIDVLKKLPDLYVNQVTDAISIKGMSNILVMLNGVLSPMDTKLKSIDPQNIEKIEVITNPSSEYDTDVEGVVNIILKEERTQGFFFNFDGNYLAPLSRIEASPSFTYNWKRAQYYFSYNYSFWGRHDKDTTHRNFVENEQNYTYNSKAKNDKYIEQSHSIYNRFDYNINKNNFLSFSANTNFDSRNMTDNIFATNYLNDALMNSMLTSAKDTSKYYTGNYTLFYKKAFAKNEGQNFTVNFNFHNMNSGTFDEYAENKSINDTILLKSIRNETTNATRYSYNLKLDYYHPVTEKFSYNVGALSYYQTFNNRFMDGEQDTSYRYSNLKNHLYLDIILNIKGFYMRLGNKAENYLTYLESEQLINKYEYLPSFAISKKFLNHHQLNLNFRSEGYAPSVWALTPYTTYSADSSSASAGNPQLKPQTRYSTSLTYLFRKNNNMLRIIAAHSYVKNMIVAQNTIIGKNTVMKAYTNMPGKNRWLLTTIYAYESDLLDVGATVTPFFEYFTHPNGYRDNISCYFSAYAYWYLPLDFEIDVEFDYNGHKILTPNGYYVEKPELNLYAFKQFLGGSIKIMLGYSGLFFPQESISVTDIDNLYEWNKHTSTFRGVFFRFQYFLKHGKDFEQKHMEKYRDDDIKA